MFSFEKSAHYAKLFNSQWNCATDVPVHAICLIAGMLCACSSFAAQCKGVTLQGERCKREAVEKKEYCAQHADQAVKYRCKSLTEDGKQCCRNAVSRSFFCAQHEAGKKLADPKAEIGACRAVTDAGRQCSRKAVPGWRYCEQHRK